MVTATENVPSTDWIVGGSLGKRFVFLLIPTCSYKNQSFASNAIDDFSHKIHWKWSLACYEAESMQK